VTKDNRKYTRTIRLAPALGDWTVLSPDAVSEPPIKIRPVQSVNFDSLPREILRTAHYVHYRLAEQICTKLSKDMDIKVEIHTVSASQMTYAHFVQSIGDQVIQSDLIAPSGDRINVLIDWPLAEQIIDRLTGGTGESAGSDEFSAIEAGILETQMEELVKLLPNVWRHSWEFDQLTFEFHAGTYHPNRKVSSREAYIVFEYQLLIGNGNIHRISWAYPNALIRAMLANFELSTRQVTPTIALDDSALSRNKVPVKVILGNAQVAMSDLRSLRVGDVLLLDSSINAPLKLVLGSDTELTVQPGTIEDRLCAQVIVWNADTNRPPDRRRQATTPVVHMTDVAPITTAGAATAAAVAAGSFASEIMAPTTVRPDPVMHEPPATSFNYPAEPAHDDPEQDIFGTNFNLSTDESPSDDDHFETSMGSTESFEYADHDEHHDNDTYSESPLDGLHDDAPHDADIDDDDHFDSDDLFSSDYDLDNTEVSESDTPPSAADEADSDDEFSWDDLEDEL